MEWDERIVGGAAIDTYGVPIRDEDVAACLAADAVFLGACGGPKWDNVDPKIRPEQALFRLRKELGLFANVRPVTVPRALAHSSPLRPELLEAVELGFLLDLAECLVVSAKARNESRGGHFREEYQTPDGEALRDDANFAHAACWEYTGDGSKPIRNVEPLVYENVHLATRSYK